MSVFKFRARDSNQRIVQGRVKAVSKEEVEKKLITRNLVLVSAVPEDETKPSVFSMSFGGVSSKKLVISTRQLSFLVNASVPIVQALETVSSNTDDLVLKKVFHSLSVSIASGQSFSAALKKFPHIFDDLYLNMVKSGEEGGSLDVVLRRLAAYIEKTESIKNRVKSAMMYPTFVMIAATLIMIGIIVFLVPKFEEIFSQAGQDLPVLTQMIVTLSHFMRDHFFLLILGIGGFIVGLIMFVKSSDGAKIFEKFLLKLPGFGPLISKNYIANYSRTLSSLLNSGVNIIEAIQIAGRSSGSILIRESSDRAAGVVSSGFNFGKAIAREKIFPDLVKNMILVGEETGNVDDVLGKIADFYEEQVDAAVEGLVKLIEPALIVGVALMIGFVLIALYLPIFQISGTLAG